MCLVGVLWLLRRLDQKQPQRTGVHCYLKGFPVPNIDRLKLIALNDIKG
jgi:hypothetical protein